MAENVLGRNVVFPIHNADGTPFHDLVLHKSTVESIVMSLGDKITGDVYYKDNSLAVTMQEYIEYKSDPSDQNEQPVRYVLVSPPTVVREGVVADNSELKGMTKYSFTFYHPMYMLGNFPFTDIAVAQDERKYLSQNKTFSWIGNMFEFIAKLNANLRNTEWHVVANIAHYEQDGHTETAQWQKASKISDVLSFDKQYVSDALKTTYDTWEIPFVITAHSQVVDGVQKRFLIEFGLPTQEILDGQGQPFVFRFGQGVGLKNNSRNPRNNKIVTRIAGTGAERNIPYGYPQIVWTGDQTWEYTINNDASEQYSYPIYDGIVGGQKVRLIKHPFTRTTLMPSIYSETVNKKVNPLATGYDPDTEIKDYYDADNSYPNPINLSAPSFENHEFEDIYPRLGEAAIVDAVPYNGSSTGIPYITWADFLLAIDAWATAAVNEKEAAILRQVPDTILAWASTEEKVVEDIAGSYIVRYIIRKDSPYVYVKYISDTANFEYTVLQQGMPAPSDTWDDTMDDDGNYVQSYFKITLPQLSFDLYASAAITEKMDINMRSGRCLGCTFPVQVDWEDYKLNFYDANGDFAPTGAQRNYERYPDSSQGSITVIVQKDNSTFGTLMPNIYQQPLTGDKFVILGISLPLSYITAAEQELDSAMREYMLENNVHYYDYPLKFDEHFLATHTNILKQIRNNNVVRFQYAGVEMALYIKQITVKYGSKVLPEYDITLSDDIEIVLNQIGQVTDDVSRMRVQLSELQKYYSENLIQDINSKLSRIVDDVCQGRITFQQGLTALGAVYFSDKLQSPNFQTGLYDGQGWRIDQLGNAELESLRVRSFLEVVELIVNRLQAQEGDTMFTDNDQIDYVEMVVDETDESVSYILSLKEKWEGYVTGQMYGNILRGIINTLAAKQAGVSDYASTSVETDGENKYYTSWMRVIGTHATNAQLGVNQIQVVLYGDNEVPAQRNFAPCELMTIARWGCVDYSDPEDPDYETVKASIARRQRMFLISVTDGRVTKYMGVDSPILRNGNYGVTMGELPEFVKNYADVASVLAEVGVHTDWLYAQGVVVGNFVKITREGLPVPVTVFCEEWIDGTSNHAPITIQVWNEQQQQYVSHTLTYPIPTSEYEKDDSYYIGYGIYFYNKWNAMTQQYEVHEVRHNGGRWKCIQSQPVKQGGVYVSNEPRWNSPYWALVDGNDNLSIEFVSSKGYSFRKGYLDTVIDGHLFYGNVDITADVAAVNWTWTRESESGKTAADTAWDAQHVGLKSLHLTDQDMPDTWSYQDKVIFTLTIVVNDGKTTRIVDNQIIS